ncbi:MAG: hypothetical protein ACPL7B_07495 [Candidatus Poribacteria bacterium]
MGETQKTKELIHKLNHYLVTLYSNIEISLLSMQDKEFFGESVDVVELLSEAFATKDEVKAIISKIFESVNNNPNNNS